MTRLQDEVIGDALLPSEPGEVSDIELERLWDLFLQIAVIWNNTDQEMRGKRSSWLEFIRERALRSPSYLTEYRYALLVMDELIEHGDFESAARCLLLEHELPRRNDNGMWTRPWTRLDHAKKYVSDEFILVYIVAAGFRDFGSDEGGKNRRKRRPYNYNGFVRGSRYNRVKRVRHYDPKESELKRFSELEQECQSKKAIRPRGKQP